MPFAYLGLGDALVQALRDANYTEPTPIQKECIPVILEGRDVVGQAQTGSGKTAAFVLPILQKLSEFIYKKDKPIRALILCPTRELANQVNESVQNYGRLQSPKLQSTAVFGGVAVDAQVNKLRRGMDILVATPGRLLDLEKQGLVKLNKVQYLVVDEADRMLDMGFISELRQIKAKLPAVKQTLLFSATFNAEVEELIRNLTRNALEVRAQPAEDMELDIEHLAHPVLAEEKMSALIHLLRANRWDQVLIFANTKTTVDLIAEELRGNQIKTAIMHGDFTQKERSDALRTMKEGRVIALVATDVASRGIDIPELPCVINYDLPPTLEDYVHRTGRTGRAGNSGLAISLVHGAGLNKIKEIEKDLGIKITLRALAHFKKAPSTIANPKDKGNAVRGPAKGPNQGAKNAKSFPGGKFPPKGGASRSGQPRNSGPKPSRGR